MKEEELRPGTKVRNGKDGRIGAVIPDLPGHFCCCGEDEVLVEYDGSSNTEGTERRVLVILEIIEPKIGPKICQNCVFCDGSVCLRYRAARYGMLFSTRDDRCIPNRIYPDCKNLQGIQ